MGVYTRNQKLNVLMDISGSDVTPLRWVDTWTGKETTLHWFYAFILWIVDDIDKRLSGQVFCFVMDNLNVHKNPMVWMLIVNRGHQVVFRAPYWAVDDAIEYAFNTVHTMIEVLFGNVNTFEELQVVVDNTVAAVPSFV